MVFQVTSGILYIYVPKLGVFRSFNIKDCWIFESLRINTKHLFTFILFAQNISIGFKKKFEKFFKRNFKKNLKIDEVKKWEMIDLKKDLTSSKFNNI